MPTVMFVPATVALARGWITRPQLAAMKERLLKDAGLRWEDGVPTWKVACKPGEPFKKQFNVPPAYVEGMSDDEFKISVIIEGNHR